MSESPAFSRSSGRCRRLQRPWVLFGQLLDVDVLERGLVRGGEPDARGLEELDDLAGIAINGPMGFVVDDQVEVRTV
jgi:hypothetical protein